MGTLHAMLRRNPISEGHKRGKSIDVLEGGGSSCSSVEDPIIGGSNRQEKAGIAEDWQKRNGYRPVLVETFVEIPRFHRTCYKMANWIYLVQTQGRGKLDVNHAACLPVKSIGVYPLVKNFRCDLCD